jgi:hypothetical protein
MRRTIVLAAGALMLALLLIVWMLPLPLPRVDDIAVTGVELVQHNDIPKQDRDGPIRDMDGPFLRVTFTSGHDFQKLAHDWNYTLGYEVASCAGNCLDASKPLAGFLGVYDGRGPIFMYADKRATSGPAPFSYHLYIAVRAEPNLDVDTGQPQPNYDLNAHPQDICLRIDGLQEVDGDGWGFARFRSNVVRINKSVIAKAL